MLILRYNSPTTIPVEAECITPDNLAGKSADEIRRLAVQHGNRQESLGEFFQADGDASDRQIRLEGDMRCVKWVGAGMSEGRITIEGNIGMHIGAEMRGGSIVVTGSAGDWVGAEMRGGLIDIHGDAGHQVGAAYRGSRRGMRGGVILVHGSAGNEIGSTMRRGLVAIGGAAGDFAGVSMIAGSVLLFGSVGVRPGAGMKRGTIALFGPAAGAGDVRLLPTFKYDCTYRPVFMTVLVSQLCNWDFPAASGFTGTRSYRRYSGDLVALGLGEILIGEG